jgi:hypothetical protein
MGICRLCLKEKKLIDAHIIPKFMFNGMKDEKNSFLEVVHNLDTNISKVKRTQKEDYDKNILCGDCDNKILGAIYEDYAKKSFYGGEISDTEIEPECINYKNPHDGAEYSVCKNIDYGKMKLFLLSLLWRASITDRPTFKDVNIGEKHEERIRKMIFESIIPGELEYPIIMTSFMRTDHDLKNFIGQPKRIKMKSGLNGYIFLIDSIQFIFAVNSIDHMIPEYLKRMTIKESGEMTIAHLPNGKELDIMKLLVGK